MTAGRGLLAAIGLALAAAVLVLGSLLSARTEGAIAGVTAALPSPGQQTCLPPPGWATRPLAAGESLAALAESYRLPLGELLSANCLPEADLAPGRLVYLPESTPTPPAACGPPPDWVLTFTGSTDDLGGLAATFGLSEQELRQANCLEAGAVLRAGHRLYLPATPTATASPASTQAELLAPSATP
jgi:hypothetical protein